MNTKILGGLLLPLAFLSSANACTSLEALASAKSSAKALLRRANAPVVRFNEMLTCATPDDCSLTFAAGHPGKLNLIGAVEVNLMTCDSKNNYLNNLNAEESTN